CFPAPGRRGGAYGSFWRGSCTFRLCACWCVRIWSSAASSRGVGTWRVLARAARAPRMCSDSTGSPCWRSRY
ncbi:hypothetical protein, partial [Arthrobacter sp. DR-2P]